MHKVVSWASPASSGNKIRYINIWGGRSVRSQKELAYIKPEAFGRTKGYFFEGGGRVRA